MHLGEREALALRDDALVHPLGGHARDGGAVAAKLGLLVLEVLEVVVDRAPLVNAVGGGVAGRRPDVVDLGLLDQVLDGGKCTPTPEAKLKTRFVVPKLKATLRRTQRMPVDS